MKWKSPAAAGLFCRPVPLYCRFAISASSADWGGRVTD